jgi:protein arginine kinase activator
MGQCEQCGKKDATVHLTQISPTGTMVYRLCEDCAKTKGITITVSAPQGEAAPQQQAEPEPSVPEKVCQACGQSLSAFREKGRLGCADCYHVFTDEIDRMLTEVHGACVHRGKAYSRVGALRGTPDEMRRLRNELDEAIQNEDFEEAARLRDTLNALSSQE